MKRALLLAIATFYSAFPAIPAFSQVRVTASVDQTTIGTEETVRYTIEIAGAAFSEVSNPEPPDALGLTLIQRASSTQQNVTMVGGKRTQSISFTWHFRASKEGNARIAGTSVSVAGRSYPTDPISLRVVPQSERPAGATVRGSRWRMADPNTTRAPELPTISQDDVFIRAVAAKSDVFQNEEFVIEYVLYFRNGVLLRNSRLADSWDTEGFWREDLKVEQRRSMRSEVVRGIRYNAVTLKRVALFPTRSGELLIESLRVESEVALPRGSTSFRSLLFEPTARFQRATVTSPAVAVSVHPLKSPPKGFNGAVGVFQIHASADRTNVEAGEPIQFTVVISGRGNIATLAEPPLELPALIEQFGPEITDSIDRSRNSVTGSKTFIYTLVPRSGGKHVIPGFSIPYYNPDRSQFEFLKSDPIAVTVSGAIIPATSTIPSTRFPLDDIAQPHVEVVRWILPDPTPLHEKTWPYALIALPLVGLGVLFLYRRRLERLATDEHYAKSRRAHPAAKKHLQEAERLLAAGNGRALYEEIANAVQGFVGNRLGLSRSGMTMVQLESALRNAGLRQAVVTRVVEILIECDTGRFSPESPDAAIMEDVVERAAHLIAGIHEYAGTSGGTV